MKTILSSVMVATACLALPSLAAAQDDRWTPWLGCWTRITEGVRQGTGVAQATALSPSDPDIETPVAAPRSCITRSGAGVSVTVSVPGEPDTVQTFLADGSPRQIDEGDCRGVERRDWSANGRRLFLKADVTCGIEPPRAVTGMGLITTRGEWLDIRSFRQDGVDLTTVTRYRRVEGTIYESTRLTIDEVKEASSKVAAPVLEAAIAESRSRIPANKRTLMALDDANVPPTVIDVIVAMAYPDKFIVESPARSVSSSSPPPRAVSSSSSGFYPDYYYNPLAYSYYGMFYTPYYPYYPSYPPGYYPIVGPPIAGGGGGGDFGGGDGNLPVRGGARAINGLGYTRIREVEPQPVVQRTTSRSGNPVSSSNSSSGSGSSGSGSSSASSASDGGSSSSSSSGGGGGGGGAAASPQGYSGGGDGGGRTAQPR